MSCVGAPARAYVSGSPHVDRFPGVITLHAEEGVPLPQDAAATEHAISSAEPPPCPVPPRTSGRWLRTNRQRSELLPVSNASGRSLLRSNEPSCELQRGEGLRSIRDDEHVSEGVMAEGLAAGP